MNAYKPYNCTCTSSRSVNKVVSNYFILDSVTPLQQLSCSGRPYHLKIFSFQWSFLGEPYSLWLGLINQTLIDWHPWPRPITVTFSLTGRLPLREKLLLDPAFDYNNNTLPISTFSWQKCPWQHKKHTKTNYHKNYKQTNFFRYKLKLKQLLSNINTRNVAHLSAQLHYHYDARHSCTSQAK